MKLIKTILISFLFLFVLSYSSAQSQIDKEDGYLYICSYNVYIMGGVAEKYKSVEEDYEGEYISEIPKRIKNNAQVLSTCDFDLIVLQEVKHGISGSTAVEDLVSVLNNDYGRSYKFIVSDHIGRGLIPESMAFIYNPNVIKPEIIDDGTSLFGYEQSIKNSRKFVRTQWQAGNFDFTLYSCHFAWGNETKRNADYDLLEKILTTPTPSAYSEDPDIIVLGDFNRFGDRQEGVKRVEYNSELFWAPNITFFDPNFNSIKEVRQSDLKPESVPNNNPQFVSTTISKNTMVYDAFYFTKDVSEEFNTSLNDVSYNDNFGIVCFDEVGGTGYIEGVEQYSQYDAKTKYSDHRPIWMKFKMESDNQDGNEIPTTYVTTKYGRKFHKRGCSTIKNSTIQESWDSRSEAISQKAPCGVCKP